MRGTTKQLRQSVYAAICNHQTLGAMFQIPPSHRVRVGQQQTRPEAVKCPPLRVPLRLQKITRHFSPPFSTAMRVPESGRACPTWNCGSVIPAYECDHRGCQRQIREVSLRSVLQTLTMYHVPLSDPCLLSEPTLFVSFMSSFAMTNTYCHNLYRDFCCSSLPSELLLSAAAKHHSESAPSLLYTQGGRAPLASQALIGGQHGSFCD